MSSPWCENVDIVVNLASSSDVPSFLDDPFKHTMNNVLSTLNLLEWARHQKLRAFVQVSTNEVYGPLNFKRSHEWDSLRPQTPYSASKACQEMLTLGWHQAYDVPVIIVNTMHIFGEGQPLQRFVPKTINAILSDQPVQIQSFPQGAPVRNWTYVGDFAYAIYRLLQRAEDMVGQRLNVAGPELSCLEVAQKISTLLEKTFTIQWLTDERHRPGHDYRYALDTSKLGELDWLPRYGVATGLHRTIHWIERERSIKDEA